jgi:hypothetical protein
MIVSYFVAFQWLVVGFQEGNIFGFHLLRNRDHSLVHLYTKIFGMILEELSGIERDLVHKDAFECAARDHLTTSQSQELYSYFLLRMGLNVNELTGVRWSCWTPLLYATACFGTKNMPWIRTLLCNGFDIAATDGRGRNALHLVLMTCNKSDHMQYWRIIRRNIKEKLYLLLAAGCNPKAVDNNGLSPAHYAWKHNLWEVWEASLLSSGYDLEAAPPAIGKFGADPFFHAFRHCHFCD